MIFILRLQNFPAIFYIAVTLLTRIIYMYKKLMYVLFWMSYAMFVEDAFLN